LLFEALEKDGMIYYSLSKEMQKDKMVIIAAIK
jgi:hypothetical protein